MNGRERVLAAFRGEPPDRVPVMLHNFMMAAAEAGVSMADFRTKPKRAADAFEMSVEKYGHDGVMVDFDTVLLAEACGVPAEHPEDMPSRATGAKLGSLAEARELAPVDLSQSRRVQAWLETVRELKRRFGGEVLVRGNCDQAPYSIAALMRGPEDWMMEIAGPANEADARVLLEFATGVSCQFLRLMAETGADMLSGGDSLSGPSVISPRLYEKFAQPYETRIIDYAHSLGLQYVLHICGKTDLILDRMANTGADGLELDYKTDVVKARDTFAGRTVFLGNIDPSGVLANGTPEAVRAATLRLLNVFEGNPRFVLNAGCAIPASTPPENLRAMIECVR